MPAIFATAYHSLVDLQRPGQQILLLQGLRRHPRVDAGAAQKQQLLHPGQPGRLDDIRLDHQVLVKKVRRPGVVRQDPAHLRRRQEHILRPLPLEELPHRPLLAQIQLPAGTHNEVAIPLLPQPPDDRRPHQTAVTRDVYLCFLVHVELSEK